MQCPKCGSRRTYVEFPPDEYMCKACVNTFYDQSRVITDLISFPGHRIGKKARPTISGVAKIYETGGLL